MTSTTEDYWDWVGKMSKPVVDKRPAELHRLVMDRINRIRVEPWATVDDLTMEVRGNCEVSVGVECLVTIQKFVFRAEVISETPWQVSKTLVVKFHEMPHI